MGQVENNQNSLLVSPPRRRGSPRWHRLSVDGSEHMPAVEEGQAIVESASGVWPAESTECGISATTFAEQGVGAVDTKINGAGRIVLSRVDGGKVQQTGWTIEGRHVSARRYADVREEEGVGPEVDEAGGSEAAVVSGTVEQH